MEPPQKTAPFGQLIGGHPGSLACHVVPVPDACLCKSGARTIFAKAPTQLNSPATLSYYKYVRLDHKITARKSGRVSEDGSL